MCIPIWSVIGFQKGDFSIAFQKKFVIVRNLKLMILVMDGNEIQAEIAGYFVV